MDQHIHYTEEQDAAIALGIDRSKKLVGITGPAGVGKTLVIGRIYSEGPWEMPMICAPTGRAAKRIQEATGFPARTIHRMMRYSMPMLGETDPVTGEEDAEAGMSLPTFDAFNKLPYDCVIVDEASMVSEELYRAVISALPSGCVIRFVGDANQLPPVEGVSPFLGILAKWPSVTLTKNFRSGDGIVTAATQIIANRVPDPNPKFRLLNPGLGNTLPALEEFIDDGFRGLQGQLIIPVKSGKYGTIALNSYLQQKLNPTGPVIKYQVDEETVRKIRVGDKIIQTKNDYKLNLFNGMIGWVVDIDDDDIILNFGGKDIVIPPHLESFNPSTGRSIFQYDPRKNIDLAYAITTHKSQGSEFDRVVLIINKSRVLCRANFYTAVTRAKDQCTVICGPGALAMAIKK